MFVHGDTRSSWFVNIGLNQAKKSGFLQKYGFENFVKASIKNHSAMISVLKIDQNITNLIPEKGRPVIVFITSFILSTLTYLLSMHARLTIWDFFPPSMRNYFSIYVSVPFCMCIPCMLNRYTRK